MRCPEVATFSYPQLRARWRKRLWEVLKFLLVRRVRWEEEDVDLGAHEPFEPRVIRKSGNQKDILIPTVGLKIQRMPLPGCGAEKVGLPRYEKSEDWSRGWPEMKLSKDVLFMRATNRHQPATIPNAVILTHGATLWWFCLARWLCYSATFPPAPSGVLPSLSLS